MPLGKRPGHASSGFVSPQASIIQPAVADDNHPIPHISAHDEKYHFLVDFFSPTRSPSYPVGYHTSYPDGDGLYKSPLDDRSSYHSTSGTALLPLVASSYPEDKGLVLTRQRRQQIPREKKRIICQFLGNRCDFMKGKDGQAFKNYAELKEDMLRHLNPFQCGICGKRFGKRYSIKLHISKKKKKPCVPVTEGGNNKSVSWVSQGLKAAVLALEQAKGGENVILAIDKCKQLCYLNQSSTTASPGHGALSQQDIGIQDSLYSPPGPALGFPLDPEQLLQYREPGSEQYDTSRVSNARGDIYMICGDEPPGGRELKRISQGPQVVNPIDHRAELSTEDKAYLQMQNGVTGAGAIQYAGPVAHGMASDSQFGPHTHEEPPPEYTSIETSASGPLPGDYALYLFPNMGHYLSVSEGNTGADNMTDHGYLTYEGDFLPAPFGGLI